MMNLWIKLLFASVYSIIVTVPKQDFKIRLFEFPSFFFFFFTFKEPDFPVNWILAMFLQDFQSMIRGTSLFTHYQLCPCTRPFSKEIFFFNSLFSDLAVNHSIIKKKAHTHTHLNQKHLEVAYLNVSQAALRGRYRDKLKAF